MSMTYLRVFLLSLCAWTFSACSEQKAHMSIGSAQGLKYTVVNKGEALADGFSDLNVEIRIEDLLGHLMPNKLPPTDVLGDLSINSVSCTLSDINGVSRCAFRSTLEGKKQVAVGSLTRMDITFLPIDSKPTRLFGIVPGVEHFNDTSTNGFVSASVGMTMDQPQQNTIHGFVFTDSTIHD